LQTREAETGALIILGQLIEAEIYDWFNKEVKINGTLVKKRGSIDFGIIFLDENSSQGVGEAYCLPILIYSTGYRHNVRGLILKSADKAGLFKRVGIFEFSTREFPLLIEGLFDNGVTRPLFGEQVPKSVEFQYEYNVMGARRKASTTWTVPQYNISII
jgi:hypothetical protein